MQEPGGTPSERAESTADTSTQIDGSLVEQAAGTLNEHLGSHSGSPVHVMQSPLGEADPAVALVCTSTTDSSGAAANTALEQAAAREQAALPSILHADDVPSVAEQKALVEVPAPCPADAVPIAANEVSSTDAMELQEPTATTAGEAVASTIAAVDASRQSQATTTPAIEPAATASGASAVIPAPMPREQHIRERATAIRSRYPKVDWSEDRLHRLAELQYIIDKNQTETSRAREALSDSKHRKRSEWCKEEDDVLVIGTYEAWQQRSSQQRSSRAHKRERVCWLHSVLEQFQTANFDVLADLLPGRTREQVRNHYRYLVRNLSGQPDSEGSSATHTPPSARAAHPITRAVRRQSTQAQSTRKAVSIAREAGAGARRVVLDDRED